MFAPGALTLVLAVVLSGFLAGANAQRTIGASGGGVGRVEQLLKESDQALSDKRPDDALMHAASAVEAGRRLLGERHLKTMEAMAHHGTLLGMQGRHAEAVPLLRKARELAAEIIGSKDPLVAYTLHNEAIALMALRQDDRATPLLVLEASLMQELYGDLDERTLAARRNLAKALLNQGRNIEVVPLLRQRLDQLKTVRGNRHPETLDAIRSYAFALGNAGRTSESLLALREGLASSKSLHGDLDPATLLMENDYALMLLGLGEAGVEEALERYERLRRISAEARGARDPETLTILHNYALALTRQGRPAEAVAVYAQVLQGRRQALGDMDPLTLQSSTNLAMQHGLLGNWPLAMKQLETALSDHLAVYGEGHPETIRTMSSLAMALGQVGRKDEELRLREHVYRLLGRGHGDVAWAAHTMGLVHALKAVNRSDETLPILEQFVARAELERRDAVVISTDAQQARFAEHLVGYLSLAETLASRDRVSESFEVVERTKARGLVDRMATSAALEAGAVPLDAAVRLMELGDSLTELNARMVRETDADIRAKLRDGRARAAADLQEYQGSLKDRYPVFRQLIDVPQSKVVDAAKVLDRETVFVSYVVRGDHIVSYSLHQNGQVRYQASRSVPGLADAIEAFRVFHTGPGGVGLHDGEGALLKVLRWTVDGGNRWRVVDTTACGSASDARQAQPQAASTCPPAGARVVAGTQARDDLAKALGAALLEPITQDLAGMRRVIVSPDGPLALLPFDLLKFRGRLVVETHEVSFVHSLSVLSLLRQRLDQYEAGPRRRAMLAMGDPSYQSTAGGSSAERRRMRNPGVPTRDATDGSTVAKLRQFEWEDLPWTAREIDAASKLFADQGALKLDRSSASEVQLRKLSEDGQLATFRYLLFAAHGYFDKATPAASALVLAREGPELERDGLVTLAEWPAIRLRSDLAILSACDTGRGAIDSGEGLIGIGYALYVAGNVNTVLTLWPIADEATAAFITSYLLRVKSGQPLVAALTATKREFLRHPKLPYRDPYYWAAFVINGV